MWHQSNLSSTTRTDEEHGLCSLVNVLETTNGRLRQEARTTLAHEDLERSEQLLVRTIHLTTPKCYHLYIHMQRNVLYEKLNEHSHAGFLLNVIQCSDAGIQWLW